MHWNLLKKEFQPSQVLLVAAWLQANGNADENVAAAMAMSPLETFLRACL
jgi:hypothetical protein